VSPRAGLFCWLSTVECRAGTGGSIRDSVAQSLWTAEPTQGDVPVSRVCERCGARPAHFYTWQKPIKRGVLAGRARRRH